MNVGIFKKFHINNMLRRTLHTNSNSCEIQNKKLKTEEEASEQTSSKYFVSTKTSETLADNFLRIQLRLNNDLKSLNFKPPVKYIYNPVEYAFEPNKNYIKKFCTGPKKLVFVGMNPGPYGMCQTGVPFGDVNWVSNWLNVKGEVTKPTVECPQRLILGFENRRKEQSGDRFWGFFAKLCEIPDKFFKHSFVYNYCPLAFLKDNGGNLTPAEIKDHKDLEEICDKHYLDILKLLEPQFVIAVGTYIEKQTVNLFKKNNIGHIKVLRIAHPSPRAINNNNWPEKAQQFLESNNLIKFFKD